MSLIKCRDCGREISDKTLSCIHCGCPVHMNNVENKIHCIECGYELNENVNFCTNCGASVSKPVNSDNLLVNNSNDNDVVDFGSNIVLTNSVSNNNTGNFDDNILIDNENNIVGEINNNDELIDDTVNGSVLPKIFLIGFGVLFVFVVIGFLVNSDNEDVLNCNLVADYGTYNVESTHSFVFEDDVLSNYQNSSYMKFDSTKVGEMMFKFLDLNSDDFNKYEGVTYKVTFNIDNEVRLSVGIDVISAPEMFVSFISYDEIDEYSSINEIIDALEKDKYICTIE